MMMTDNWVVGKRLWLVGATVVFPLTSIHLTRSILEAVCLAMYKLTRLLNPLRSAIER